MFSVSQAWRDSYPAAHVGVLSLQGCSNPSSSTALDEEKHLLEARLREEYAGEEALQISPILKSYDDYYRKFKKTYHLRLQLESIVSKGKSIASASGLVESMFMAEMQNLLLTAGHDLDTIDPPLTLDVANGSEGYILLRGEPQQLKPGDMYIRDRQGVISSIIYGPDQRTQIHASTIKVIYTVYAPQGINLDLITRHMTDIQSNVMLFAPQTQAVLFEIYGSA
jgi:DNA/RNA-binding domain of Phe-tRNA-synthetase-like protein